jgi:prepilin-type N-terminal cleavage/methylation domain-containing protein
MLVEGKKSFMRKKAFTMVELIVVLAILAILAIGMWTLINPIEQMAKATDGTRQSNAREVASVIATYVVSYQNQYPWNVQSEFYSSGPRQPAARFNSDQLGLAWLNEIASKGEMKEATTNKIVSEGIYHIYKDTGETVPVYVCFEPTSLAYKQQAAAACQDNSAPRISGATICVTTDGSIAPDGSSNLLCLST